MIGGVIIIYILRIHRVLFFIPFLLYQFLLYEYFIVKQTKRIEMVFYKIAINKKKKKNKSRKKNVIIESEKAFSRYT